MNLFDFFMNYKVTKVPNSSAYSMSTNTIAKKIKKVLLVSPSYEYNRENEFTYPKYCKSSLL